MAVLDQRAFSFEKEIIKGELNKHDVIKVINVQDFILAYIWKGENDFRDKKYLYEKLPGQNMYNWLGLCGMDCILLLVTIVCRFPTS